ncbi:Riboflavin biosynthesis protein RibF [compost metagenome]
MLEVHALGFSGDLYRRHVRVEFLRKLRDEEKYADLATLTRQIALDAQNARAFFKSWNAPVPRRAG